jgi:hypothetical protein
MTPGVQAFRRRAAAVEREIDAAVAGQKAERRAELEALKRAAVEREANRRRFTRDDIVGAGFVHDGTSWRKVVRVNRKTVSVVNWQVPEWEPDRIPFDRVHGVQMPIEGT